MQIRLSFQAIFCVKSSGMGTNAAGMHSFYFWWVCVRSLNPGDVTGV